MNKSGENCGLPLGATLSMGWHIAWKKRTAMVAYTLLAWLVSGIVLVPLVTLVLRSLARYGDVIVGNYTIHRWLMTPRGITYLLLAGSVLLFAIFMQLGGLMQIAGLSGDEDDVSATDALRGILARRHNLLHFCLALFLLSLPFAAVMAAGPGLAYLLLLTRHDINFYLTYHPPQWDIMIGISLVWLLITGGITLVVFLRCLVAIPVWLDGEKSVRNALSVSLRVTRNRYRPLLRAILVCVLLTIAAKLVADGIFSWIAGMFLNSSDNTMEKVVRVMSAYLLARGALDTVIIVLGLFWGIGIWVVFYRRCAREDMSHIPLTRLSMPASLKVSALALHMRAFIVVLALLFVGSWGMSIWILRQNVPTKIPLVIAHRAGAANAPENTLAALQRVIREKKADMAEIDVSMTADGVLIIEHDTDLMKQAQDPRMIIETKYRDIKDVDIGSFYSSEYAGEHLGKLREFLDMAHGKIPLIVEFKHQPGSNLVDSVVATVREADMQDEVILMSLNIDEVRRVQKLAPDIRVGYFVSVEVGDLRLLDVDVIGAKDGMVDHLFVKEMQDKGIKVYVWTVDDPVRILELALFGVDGIITNNPNSTKAILKRLAALTPEQRLLLRFRKVRDILRKNNCKKIAITQR